MVHISRLAFCSWILLLTGKRRPISVTDTNGNKAVWQVGSPHAPFAGLWQALAGWRDGIMEDKNDGDGGGARDRNYSPAMIGTSLTLGSAVLVLTGYWLDRRAGGGFARTIAGLVLAIVYIAYEVWKVSRSISGTDRHEGRPRGKDPGRSP
jgi:hypothetical protein